MSDKYEISSTTADMGLSVTSPAIYAPLVFTHDGKFIFNSPAGEVLKIENDTFSVKGVEVKEDKEEVNKVYKAMQLWLKEIGVYNHPEGFNGVKNDA